MAVGVDSNSRKSWRAIRQRHRAKRNLIKRLDERGWAQSAVARPPDSPPPRRAVHS